MRLGWLALCGVFVASDLMAQDDATAPAESMETSETGLSEDGDDAAPGGRLFEVQHQMIPAFRAMIASPFTMACGSP